MLISELAKRSGLSIDTIRFYEKKELIAEKKELIASELIQRRSNNYREYSEVSLERLRLIQQAKRLGFTLIEIREWIEDLESDQLTIHQKQIILGRKLEEIEERINDLERMKVYLLEKLDHLHKSE